MGPETTVCRGLSVAGGGTGTAAAITAYLASREGRADYGLDGPFGVSFLAAGEYNENYLVASPAGRYVFRINHGSQLGIDDQIGYEYEVLAAVAPSGVTPRPFFVDPAPAESGPLAGGVLLMDYLPGRPLDYATDLAAAAETFARIHIIKPSPRLLRQDDPVGDIAAESIGLIERFPDHPLGEKGDRLRRYHESVLRLRDETRELFAHEAPVMANTEVNSGNFLVDGETARLVDWEKAVVTSRHQDLGHFMVATTTRWKSDVVLTRKQKRFFLDRYRQGLIRLGEADVPSLDELELKAGVLERTILLRGLAWCYMAWYEYTRPGRALKNPDTFAVITAYLDEMPCLLQ